MSLFGPSSRDCRGTGLLCFSWACVLAAQKEARATCSSSPLISYTNLIMGSCKGVRQKTRQIPAAQRELTARVISCEIFTTGSYSRFCFRFRNEAAGNEKIKWKNSFLREQVGNWNSAQPSLEPMLCPGHLEITLRFVKASLAVSGLGRNVCVKWFFFPLLLRQVAVPCWQSKSGHFTLSHNVWIPLTPCHPYLPLTEITRVYFNFQAGELGQAACCSRSRLQKSPLFLQVGITFFHCDQYPICWHSPTSSLHSSKLFKYYFLSSFPCMASEIPWLIPAACL